MATKKKTFSTSPSTGRHEIIVRFAETNHFGFPTTLEEVELNLGGLLLHIFPHQVSVL
jgi:hypothetical protein